MRFMALLACLFASMLSGCVTTEAVRQFAQSSRETLSGASSIDKDFYQTCARANQYKPAGMWADCKSSRQASTEAQAVNAVLAAYVNALDNLAADSIIDASSANQLVQTTARTLGDSTERAQASGRLAAVIASAAASGFQQRQLATFITSSNDAVITVSKAYADSIRQNYGQALGTEHAILLSRYRDVERQTRDAQPLQWESYSHTALAQAAAIDDRLAASNALANRVTAIGTVHDTLDTEVRQLDAPRVIAAVQAFVDATRPALQQVQDAYSR